MKSIVCSTPGKLEYKISEVPILEKDHAIIKIKRIGVCGTDLHGFEGTQPFFDYPRVLGHELAGELVDFDNAPGFRKGEAVTVIPYFNCGTCLACRSGKPNCCSKIQVCGVHRDGGMTEYFSVPSYSLVHGDGLGFDELSLIEPLAIGAHGLRRAGIKKGDFVLVIGAGPIGLGAMQMAKIAGAHVIAMDINAGRLDFAKNNLGIPYIVNALRPAAEDLLASITNTDMPSTVIDATGNLKAINNAFKYVSHGGNYVLIGLQREKISFSHPEFHKRETTLMSSRNATKEDFERVMQAMRSGKIKPGDYITHRLNFHEVVDKFHTLLDPQKGVIKASIEL